MIKVSEQKQRKIIGGDGKCPECGRHYKGSFMRHFWFDCSHKGYAMITKDACGT